LEDRILVFQNNGNPPSPKKTPKERPSKIRKIHDSNTIRHASSDSQHPV